MNISKIIYTFSGLPLKAKTAIISLLLITGLQSCRNHRSNNSNERLWSQAVKICQNNIIIDSHIDWPDRLHRQPEDISKPSEYGDFDLIRARKGGLNAVCSVVFIEGGSSVIEGQRIADSLHGIIEFYPSSYPDKFAYARNPDDIKRNFKNHLFSIVLCMENAIPMGNNLEYLQYLKEKGYAYITLNHSKSNQIGDSSYDPERLWNGLSPLGHTVIKNMNQLGIMIDISHSTDSAVFQVIRYSEAPIIASHSSCRHFTPGYERNLSDTLIKAIAAKNGIVMINFGSQFLDSLCNQNINYLLDWFDSTGVDRRSKEGLEMIDKFKQNHKLLSNSKQVADHIDHVVKLVGIDFVGIGSDYDGIGPSQPEDMPDVSSYPVLVMELLVRSYTEDNIKKILSENFLRVWNNVIEVADSLNNR
jgi:membrane dipeptidase